MKNSLKLLTPFELCEMVGLSEVQLLKEVVKHKIPIIVCNGRILFSRVEIADWLGNALYETHRLYQKTQDQ